MSAVFHLLLSLIQALACNGVPRELDSWSTNSFDLLGIQISDKSATFKFSYCAMFSINLNTQHAPAAELPNGYQVTIDGHLNTIDICTMECVTENMPLCDEEIVLKMFWIDDKFQVDVGCPGRRIFSEDMKYEPENGLITVHDNARLEIEIGDYICPTTTTTSNTTTATTTTTTTATGINVTTITTSESITTINDVTSFDDKGTNMRSGMSELIPTSKYIITFGFSFVILYI